MLTHRLDYISDFLHELRNTDKNFHDEMVSLFVRDNLTFTGFEKDFVEALYKIKGITVSRDKFNGELTLLHGNDSFKFSCYEDLFKKVAEIIRDENI